jgi:hypothetical protein
MNQLVYNASMLAGTALSGTGAGLQWGLGVGLLVAGVMVTTLTVAGAWLFARGG